MSALPAPTLTETPASKPKPQAIDTIIHATRAYLHGTIDHLWGEFGSRGRGICITGSAMARIGQIFGWLTCLSGQDREAAEKLASNIFDKLDYLSNYGGNIEETTTSGIVHRIPNYIVELRDDGTFGGFSLAWFRAITNKQVEEYNKSHVERLKVAEHKAGTFFPYSLYSYVYSFNGGLLWFGPGDTGVGAPNYSVRFGEKLDAGWSIHT